MSRSTRSLKRSASPIPTATSPLPTKTVKTSNRHFWLIKAEPESRFHNGHQVKFSIGDLAEMKRSPWDGVRNYEARNNLKAMSLGDLCLFYHSNCSVPGVAGIARVVKESYIDYTAFDKDHPYFDPKSDKSSPRWFMTDVEFVEEFRQLLPLRVIQSEPMLKDMLLVKRGRLSVQPVSEADFSRILLMADSSTTI